MQNENVETSGEKMRHRQIRLADGRYMIFYTFGETNPASARTEEESISPDMETDPANIDV